MKVTNLFEINRRLLSFEVFPPKTDTAFESVKEATEKIAALKPDFMSVTYGAGGGTSKFTLDIAKNIKFRFGVPMIAHLTCVSSNKAFVRERIKAIKESGIENIMALRGDLTPELEKSDRSTWDYQHAIDLIRDIKEIAPEMCIGGACYPEVHPESKSMEEDIKHLKEKVDAGADFLTTQMFFDNNIFYDFLDNTGKAGINCPIIAGIMPVTNIKQIDRVTKMANCPQHFKKLAEQFSDNPEAMRKAGIYFACEQIVDLYANGIKYVHIYTMNKPDIAEEIKSNLLYFLQ